MKTISIGDIHGRDCWKDIVNNNSADVYIFIGDFVDSFTVKNDLMINNLLDIIAFKKANPDNVILLWGNHDTEYLFYPKCRDIGGFRPDIASQLNWIFKDNQDLFQVAFQIDNYLWTHAGISIKWYNWVKDVITDPKYKEDTLAGILNNISMSADAPCLYHIGRKRTKWGAGIGYGGITWADIDETREGIIPGFHQIVGHTPIDEIVTYNKIMGKTYTDRSITYIDVLQDEIDLDNLDKYYHELILP